MDTDNLLLLSQFLDQQGIEVLSSSAGTQTSHRSMKNDSWDRVATRGEKERKINLGLHLYFKFYEG